MKGNFRLFRTILNNLLQKASLTRISIFQHSQFCFLAVGFFAMRLGALRFIAGSHSGDFCRPIGDLLRPRRFTGLARRFIIVEAAFVDFGAAFIGQAGGIGHGFGFGQFNALVTMVFDDFGVTLRRAAVVRLLGFLTSFTNGLASEAEKWMNVTLSVDVLFENLPLGGELFMRARSCSISCIKAAQSTFLLVPAMTAAAQN